jgi:hypothetical protein
MSKHDPSPSRTRPRDTGTGQRSSVQSRGGIGRAMPSKKGSNGKGDTGWMRGTVDVPGPSLDGGGGKRPHDGRAHHGLSGDDAGPRSADSGALPASRSIDPAADLGRAHDRRHGISDDPAERTSGGDRPNAGGRMTGAPGGPARTVPKDLPGEDESLADDVDSAAHGGDDATRDQQI